MACYTSLCSSRSLCIFVFLPACSVILCLKALFYIVLKISLSSSHIWTLLYTLLGGRHDKPLVVYATRPCLSLFIEIIMCIMDHHHKNPSQLGFSTKVGGYFGIYPYPRKVCTSLIPDPPPKRKWESGEYSTSSHYGLAVAIDFAES